MKKILLLLLSNILITSCTKYERVIFEDEHIEFFREEGTDKWSVRSTKDNKPLFEGEIDHFERINFSGFPQGCFTISIGDKKKIISSHKSTIQLEIGDNYYTTIDRIGDKKYTISTIDGKYIYPKISNIPTLVQDIVYDNGAAIYTVEKDKWGAVGYLYPKEIHKTERNYKEVLSPIYDRVIVVQTLKGNFYSPLGYYAERNGEFILLDKKGYEAEIYQQINFLDKKVIGFEIMKKPEYNNSTWRLVTKNYINVFKNIPFSEDPKYNATLNRKVSKIGNDKVAIITIIER